VVHAWDQPNILAVEMKGSFEEKGRDHTDRVFLIDSLQHEREMRADR